MRLPAFKLASLAVLISLISPLASASELTIAQATSATAMDPGFLKEPATLVDNLFDTLVLRDPQMKLQPGLATSWKAIDASTWQFDLRQGVKFTDGEPVDAKAVKFSLDRILDPANHAHKQREWFGRMRPYIEIDWQGHLIWGITAAILANLSRRLAWQGP